MDISPVVFAGWLLVAAALGAAIVAVWVRLRQLVHPTPQRPAAEVAQLAPPEPATSATGRLYAVTVHPTAPLETRHRTNPGQPITLDDGGGDLLWEGWSQP